MLGEAAQLPIKRRLKVPEDFRGKNPKIQKKPKKDNRVQDFFLGF